MRPRENWYRSVPVAVRPKVRGAWRDGAPPRDAVAELVRAKPMLVVTERVRPETYCLRPNGAEPSLRRHTFDVVRFSGDKDERVRLRGEEYKDEAPAAAGGIP